MRDSDADDSGLRSPAEDSSNPFPPLSFREYQLCTVMPYQRRGKNDMATGVFDASGSCIPESLLRRTYSKRRVCTVGSPADFGPASTHHEGTAIYVGPLMDMFGHFLLESLARVWISEQHPETPLVWSREIGKTGPLKSWQKDILDLLGVRNPLICVEAPARFERLVIPDIGYQNQHYFHPAHADFLAKVPYEPLPGRKLWLSRSKLGGLQNESMPEVESRLADLGWTILYPETLPIREQLAQIASAERIAAEQGSALHSIILLDQPKTLRVDLFIRNPDRRGHNRNYDTIAERKGFLQRTIRIKSEIVRTTRGRKVQKYSADISEYIYKLTDDTSNIASVEEDHIPCSDLDKIALKFNTDKASAFVNRKGERVKGHDYCRFYETFFKAFRREPITIMELGCGPTWNIGASLRTFQKYFPESRIIGVDNKPQAKQLEAEGFEICVGDLADVNFVRSMGGFRPNIIIDDASHIWSHQILSISELFDSVVPGGMFIMEDINTSFGKMREKFSHGSSFSGYDFASRICETLHEHGDDHLKETPLKDSISKIAASTLFVAQYRHTALFVKK